MSLTSLLSEDVTHLAWTGGAEDAYGNVASTWASVGVLKGRLEQRSGEERTVDGNVVTSDWVLFLHPDAVIDARDRFTDGQGRTFEVTGPANLRSAPNRDVLVEVSLRHVDSA